MKFFLLYKKIFESLIFYRSSYICINISKAAERILGTKQSHEINQSTDKYFLSTYYEHGTLGRVFLTGVLRF
jgi:hypothetical protein